jgi:uncharacterized protein with von Willebrand factor type A (vWA) domain
LEQSLPPLDINIDLEAQLKYQLEELDLAQLKQMFEERMKEQKTQHHGGSKWVGTGGTSPLDIPDTILEVFGLVVVLCGSLQ